MYDPQSDLRTLYQAYSSQIEFSKTQLWRVANYGMWAIAAIIGLFKGFKLSNINPGSDGMILFASIFPAMITGVFFICLYNMSKNWLSMRTARSQYIWISKKLSKEFRETIASATGQPSEPHPFPPNYECLNYDATIVLPLMATIFIGCALGCCMLIRDTGRYTSGSIYTLPVLTFVCCSICFMIFIRSIRHSDKAINKC